MGSTLGVHAAWGGSPRVDFVGEAWSDLGVVGAPRRSAGTVRAFRVSHPLNQDCGSLGLEAAKGLMRCASNPRSDRSALTLSRWRMRPVLCVAFFFLFLLLLVFFLIGAPEEPLKLSPSHHGFKERPARPIALIKHELIRI